MMSKFSFYVCLLIWPVLLAVSCKPKETNRGTVDFHTLVNKKVTATIDTLFDRDAPKFEKCKEALKAFAIEFPFAKDSATYAYIGKELGDMYHHQHDSAIKYNLLVMPYFEAHPEFVRQLSMCYLNIGYALLQKNENIYKANYFISKAANISAKSDKGPIDTLWQIHMLINAVRLNRRCQQYEQALRFAKIAIGKTYLYRNKYPLDYVAILTESAEIYTEKHAYDSATAYLETAENFNATLQQKVYIAGILQAKGFLFKQKQMYDSSLYYYSAAAKINENPNAVTRYYIFDNYASIADIYIHLQKPKDAEKYLALADRFSAEVDSLTILNFLEYKTLFTLLYADKAKGKEMFYDYVKRKKEFYDAERLKIFASIESEYDLTQKEKSIISLNAEKKATATQLQHSTNLLLLIAFLALLIIAVFLLVLRQRRLTSQRQLLETNYNKIELEQRLLRTQMEPHFIFNTLAVLQSQVRSGDTQKASKYLNQFAHLLRISLENSRESFVSLNQEIEALESYLSLQSVRFEDKFTYAINVYQDYQDDDIQIPPMLMQPFVENAVQHGIKNINHKGHILIDIEKKGKAIFFSIQDNGIGIGNKSASEGKKSLSMLITQERLDALSRQTGEQANLHVTELSTGGTLVTMIIPCKQL